MSDSGTLWTVAPLSMGFSRQEYWSGLPFPPPGDLHNPRIKPTSLMSLHWQAGSLTLAQSREFYLSLTEANHLEASFQITLRNCSREASFSACETYLLCLIKTKNNKLIRDTFLQTVVKRKQKNIPARAEWVSMSSAPGKGALSCYMSQCWCPRKGGVYFF